MIWHSRIKCKMHPKSEEVIRGTTVDVVASDCINLLHNTGEYVPGVDGNNCLSSINSLLWEPCDTQYVKIMVHMTPSIIIQSNIPINKWLLWYSPVILQIMTNATLKALRPPRRAKLSNKRVNSIPRRVKDMAIVSNKRAYNSSRPALQVIV